MIAEIEIARIGKKNMNTYNITEQNKLQPITKQKSRENRQRENGQ